MPVPLPAKSPAESKVITFDFTPFMTPRSVLDSVDNPIVVSVISGTDSSGALVVGQAALLPELPMAVALTQAGLEGVTYGLLCTVRASNGEVHQLSVTLPISSGVV